MNLDSETTKATVSTAKLLRAKRTKTAAVEEPALRPLPQVPADISVARTVRVTNRCRVVLDTNRHSVPHFYASQQLTLELSARHTPIPGPLHLTRRPDLLGLELPNAAPTVAQARPDFSIIFKKLKN